VRRLTKLAAALFTGSLLLTACGGGAEEPSAGTTGGSGGSAAASALKVAIAYDVGGRGDQSFNDAAAAGLDKATAALGLTETEELEATDGETDADRQERLRLLADGGFNPIIAIGFVYSAALAEVAPSYPDTRFAIIDDAGAKGANIANLVFAEEEGSFLVGAAAALKSTTANVGFVGGVETPLIKKFEAGYTAGAKAVNPAITVQAQYLTQVPDFSGFGDPAKGKTAAQGMYDAGADVVYQAAGGSGGGVFEAASESGKFAIGVDSDQYKTADPAVREVIITSMLKKVDVAVSDFLTSVSEDQFTAGELVYDLEKDGVGYSTTGGKIDDIVPQLDTFKAQIVSGEITVPSS
jgi:basic membrane protein A